MSETSPPAEPNLIGCVPCKKGFPDLKSYKEHLARKHSDSDYSCKVFGADVENKIDRKEQVDNPQPSISHEKADKDEQMSFNTIDKKFQCKQCDDSFESYYKMKKHIKVKHDNIEIYKCKYCDFNSQNKQERNNHIAQCKNRKEACDNELPYECDDCKMKLKSRSSLTRHKKYNCLQTTMYNSEVLQCEKCNKRFAKQNSLNNHKLICKHKPPVNPFDSTKSAVSLSSSLLVNKQNAASNQKGDNTISTVKSVKTQKTKQNIDHSKNEPSILPEQQNTTTKNTTDLEINQQKMTTQKTEKDQIKTDLTQKTNDTVKEIKHQNETNNFAGSSQLNSIRKNHTESNYRNERVNYESVSNVVVPTGLYKPDTVDFNQIPNEDDFNQKLLELYTENWPNIMSHYNRYKASEEYCLRFDKLDDLASIEPFFTDIVIKNQTTAVKVQLSFSLVLYHPELGKLRFFYRSYNNLPILKKPYLIHSYADYKCFLKILRELSINKILDYTPPSTKWIFINIANISFSIAKLNFPLIWLNKSKKYPNNEGNSSESEDDDIKCGKTNTRKRPSTEEQNTDNLSKKLVGHPKSLPSYILSNNHLISLHSHKGKKYTDRLCMFRSLALLFNNDKKSEKLTKVFFRQYTENKYSIAEYPGFPLDDLQKLEDFFMVNVVVYEMYETGALLPNNKPKTEVRLLYQSRNIYDGTLNVNYHNGHLSYIKNLQGFTKTYLCEKCGTIFNMPYKYKRHVNSCTENVKEVFVNGAYDPRKSLYERLKMEDLNVSNTPRFFPYRITYDFETWMDRQNKPTDSDKTTFHATHRLLSISSASNVPNFTSTCHFVSEGDTEHLVSLFLDHLCEVSDHAYK